MTHLSCIVQKNYINHERSWLTNERLVLKKPTSQRLLIIQMVYPAIFRGFWEKQFILFTKGWKQIKIGCDISFIFQAWKIEFIYFIHYLKCNWKGLRFLQLIKLLNNKPGQWSLFLFLSGLELYHYMLTKMDNLYSNYFHGRPWPICF